MNKLKLKAIISEVLSEMESYDSQSDTINTPKKPVSDSHPWKKGGKKGDLKHLTIDDKIEIQNKREELLKCPEYRHYLEIQAAERKLKLKKEEARKKCIEYLKNKRAGGSL